MRRAFNIAALASAAALAACSGGCGGGGGGSGSGGAVPMLPMAAPSAPAAPAAPAAPTGPDCSVTLYGDSILYGYTSKGRIGEPPAVAIKRLRPAYRVVDRSDPGDYVLRRLPTFLSDTIDTRVVVIEHGMNDAGNGFDYAEPLRSMLQRVKALGRVAVVTGISQVVAGVPERATYDSTARRVAGEEGATFADWGAVRFDASDMADDIHPAQAYSARLVEQLVAALDKTAPECKP